MADNDFSPGVTDAGKPRAAKGGFPYPGHGPMGDDLRAKLLLKQWRAEEEQARAREHSALDGWVEGFWPHLKGWRPSRYNPKRGQWQVQITRSYRAYIYGGKGPAEVRRAG